MPIQTSTLEQMQALAATAFSANATLPANTNAGSTLGSIFNAEALLALNVQYELVYAASIARLATSFGPDVDSFVNVFAVYRIGASASSGLVTLTTPSPVVSQLLIPVGGMLATNSGLLFTIVADPGNTTGFFNAVFNAYVITASTSSANVIVNCNTTGTIGNVAIGQISQIYTPVGGPPITGIQIVANAAAFTNAVNQESDPALKARFTLAMSGGRVGSINAEAFAVYSVQEGLTVSVGDLEHPDGSSWPGGFTIVVNELGQSSGPGAPLLSACQSAALAVKSAGASFVCIGPTLINVNGAGTVYLNATLPTGLTSAQVIANVNAAYILFLNNIGLNANGGSTICPLSLVYSVLQAVPGVAYIDGLALNSSTADISAPFAFQLVAGTANFVV